MDKNVVFGSLYPSVSYEISSLDKRPLQLIKRPDMNLDCSECSNVQYMHPAETRMGLIRCDNVCYSGPYQGTAVELLKECAPRLY